MDALQIALRYLQRRARTESEIRKKLADRQIPPQEIEAVMVRLKEYGYINDQKFATDYQRFRNDFKPMGAQRLKMELQLKGIPKDVVQQVSAEFEDEKELAWRAAQTRLRQYSYLTPEIFQRRMIAFLGRRGFSYSVIKTVLDRLDKIKRDEE
jgi:regulatory protein